MGKIVRLEEQLQELQEGIAVREQAFLEFEAEAKKQNTQLQEVWTQREEMKGRFQDSEERANELELINKKLRAELDALQMKWAEAQDRLSAGESAVAEAKELREEIGHLWRKRDDIQARCEDAERRCALGAQELIIMQNQHTVLEQVEEEQEEDDEGPAERGSVALAPERGSLAPAKPPGNSRPQSGARNTAKRGSLAGASRSNISLAPTAKKTIRGVRGSILHTVQRGSDLAREGLGGSALFLAQGSHRNTLSRSMASDRDLEGPLDTSTANFLKVQNLAEGMRRAERSELALKRDCMFAWITANAAWRKQRAAEVAKCQAIKLLQRQLEFRSLYVVVRCLKLWNVSVKKDHADRRMQEQTRCKVVDQIEALNEPLKRICFLSWSWTAADSKIQVEAKRRMQQSTDTAQSLQDSLSNKEREVAHKEREARHLRSEVEQLGKQRVQLEASLKSEEVRAANAIEALQEQVFAYERKLGLNAAQVTASRVEMTKNLKANNMVRALHHVKVAESRLIGRYLYAWKEVTMLATFDNFSSTFKLRLDRALQINMAGQIAECTHRCFRLWQHVTDAADAFRRRRDTKIKSTLHAVAVVETQRRCHMFSAWAYVASCARFKALVQQLSEVQDIADIGKKDFSNLQAEFKKVNTHYQEVWKQRDEMKARFKESEKHKAEIESLVKELHERIEELMREHMEELQRLAREEEEMQRRMEKELQKQLEEERRRLEEELQRQLEEEKRLAEELQKQLDEQGPLMEELQRQIRMERKVSEDLQGQVDQERRYVEDLQQKLEEERRRLRELQQQQGESEAPPPVVIAKPSTGISRKCVDQLLNSYCHTLQLWVLLWWRRVLACDKHERLQEDLASLRAANKNREEAEKLKAEIAKLKAQHEEEALRLRAAELRYEEMQRALTAREAQLRKACVELTVSASRARKDQMMERAASKIDANEDALRAQCFLAWVFALDAARRNRAHNSSSTPSAANASAEEPQMEERLIRIASRPRHRCASTSMGFHIEDAISSGGSPPPTPRPKDPRRRADCTRWAPRTSQATPTGRHSLEGSRLLSGTPTGASDQASFLPTAPAGPRNAAPRWEGLGRTRTPGAATPGVALPVLTPRSASAAGMGDSQPFGELSGTVRHAPVNTPRERSGLSGAGSATPGFDDARRSRSAMSHR